MKTNVGRPEVDSEESPATFLIIPSGEPESPAAFQAR